MIEKYKKNEFGIIEQIDKTKKIVYDIEYCSKYDLYNKTSCMSYLRLGYILGTIRKIPDSILDVGYGNGNFLKVCLSLIKKCAGNDISKYPIPDECHFVENITSEYFEVITFFDSLEHFDDINIVKKLNCSYICISVPWCHYFSDEWFLKWKHRKYNEHLFHFDIQSLTDFMRNAGFKLINYSYIEDSIRIPIDENSNILTAIFERIT